ncbi:hypothetical protein E4K66_29860 [Bradyrhizobium frederickii]|uniref:Uncharacterized protein n=1 Tax=Bradyrhizobium frederickii TaxID=2560054 RepID=A0A4Y9KYU0_9BRAD|nr:hypothetical protein [Bradyrhizobium frederickii]TFV34832.1 hypothetical protein E4K66_29860 [Bradyrhizobium frederickii]
MSVKAIVANVLRDELVTIGTRSLTVPELEKIADHMFERITNLELELAAPDFGAAGRNRD